MKKVQTFSTQAEFFTGSTATKDFLRDGKIGISFFINDKRIGVEIAGFSSPHLYVLNAKSERAKEKNKAFIQRYVSPCHNAKELIETIFI